MTLDGGPFGFERHEYLQEPYNDDHPDQTEMKATQMGSTTRAMLRAVYGARFAGYRGILYLFPSRTDVTEFSKSRISTLIDENPDTIGSWLQDTDSANLKKLWNAFLYLRGMKSTIGLKSIPIDFIIFDELDEAPQQSMKYALARMAHSEYKHVMKLSNPSLPDYGIDKAFQETDMRYWLLKCEKCGKYTCLEDTFPDCLLEVDGRVIRACSKCKSELNPSGGKWVAKRPGIKDKRGYHYSQLFSHFVEPADILKEFRNTTNRTLFYNLIIGNAWVEATNRLEISQVLALCGSRGNASSDPGPCFMGVDQGKDLHVVISKIGKGKGEIVHLGIQKDWSELDKLMKAFNVARCVVDGMPETRNARAFAERHKRRVFLNYYSIHQKGTYKWNEQDHTVTEDRTESLDASHNEIQDGELVLPRESDIVREFAAQCHNTAKRLEEDEETGSKRYVYVKLGPDHFRHALNYSTIARQYAQKSIFGKYDLT
ncbi:MAG: phage terminase large subunit family protein [Spirochaetes bacterium]|nr:phage terminase large subunit family protein [Spirochaetota bacterium]